jgi:hypothetical protein
MDKGEVELDDEGIQNVEASTSIFGCWLLPRVLALMPGYRGARHQLRLSALSDFTILPMWGGKKELDLVVN